VSGLANSILHLHGIAALALIFAFPALEASAFVGFIFPGEIGAILGGVLASQHRVSLAGALAAVIAGAIVGDTVGYLVGRWIGGRLLGGPLSRWVAAHHVERAQQLIQNRGGWAVLLGRWAAALRVFVPGIAGMAEMSFGRFVFFNAVGGAAWGTAMVLLGWSAGSNWHALANTLGTVGLVVLGVVVVTAVVVFLAYRRRRAAAKG
jgi:membrane-associated protein